MRRHSHVASGVHSKALVDQVCDVYGQSVKKAQSCSVATVTATEPVDRPGRVVLLYTSTTDMGVPALIPSSAQDRSRETVLDPVLTKTAATQAPDSGPAHSSQLSPDVTKRP
mmetsp:Transcript_2740/g.8169  ORF Transcript_2740/g.8169 Transcript_2740/m.8169 type:complete len:112 (+) Transcript_2740:1381-1716(+)